MECARFFFALKTINGKILKVVIKVVLLLLNQVTKKIKAKVSADQDVIVTGANYAGKDLRTWNLTNVSLIGANLQGANLEGNDLRRSDLTGANLEGANLMCANLEGVFLEGANLKDANLKAANLESTNLVGANLANADLSRANLAGAALCRAILVGTILRGADLTEAKLKDAHAFKVDLTDADIHGINFSRCRLEHFVFSNTRYGTQFTVTGKPIQFDGMGYEVMFFPSHNEVYIRIGYLVANLAQWPQVIASNPSTWSARQQEISFILDCAKSYKEKMMGKTAQ